MITDRQISEIIGKAVNEVYLPAMEEQTPKKTGQTSKAWRVVIEKDSVELRNIRFGDIVRFINDGTKGPYIIEAKNALALRFVVDGQLRFAKKIVHPGIRARKFVQRVLNDKSLEKEYLQVLDRELQLIYDKL